MRKAFIFCLSLLICLLLVGCKKDEDTFLLEEKYYGSSDLITLDNEKLSTLIDDEESFAIFIYQPLCATSKNFEKVLQEFVTNHPIRFYKMAFSDIIDTELGKSVEYYPSFVIYNKGKMVDYLDANSDEDTNRYKSTEYFEEWFTKYVSLKDH